jgi:membrane protease YdiL (CAAX protease family)
MVFGCARLAYHPEFQHPKWQQFLREKQPKTLIFGGSRWKTYGGTRPVHSLIKEASMYLKWSEGWRNESGSWWRFVVTLGAFFVPLLIVNVVAVATVNAFRERFSNLAVSQKAEVQACILFAMFAPALATFLFVKNRLSAGRPSVLAAPGRRFKFRHALVSFLTLFVLLICADVALNGVPHIRAVLRGASSTSVFSAAILVLTIAIQAGTEEIVTRGYIAPRLVAWTNLPVAALASTLLFLAGHFDPGLLGAGFIVLFGVIFFFVTDLTGSVAVSSGSHIAVNVFGALVTGNKANSSTDLNDFFICGGAVLVWSAAVWIMRGRASDLGGRRAILFRAARTAVRARPE